MQNSKMRIHMTRVLSVLCVMISLNVVASAKVYDVTRFGAKNDGSTLNTESIQKAIDTCSGNGGGTVLLTGGGRFLTGTLYLKDHVTLHVDNGTVLLGSPNYADYTTDTHKIMYKKESHMDRCLIFAEAARSIAIEGHGTIDGNGHRANFKNGRPMLIRFLSCNDIQVNDITLVNPSSWTSAWLYCNNIRIDGITILSRVNGNGDGLDFDGCTNVRVSNSSFDNSDDCICLQTSRPDRPCRDVVITNCIFSTKWGGIRIGLLSRGDIHSVAVTNCTFRDIQDSGLKIQQCEGGEMRNMVFSNLIMENVPRPIFMTFCQQRACVDVPEGTYEPLKSMHNFIFQNIVVDNRKGDKNSAFFITGYPGHDIQDVTIKDVQFLVSGGGTQADAEKLDVNEYTLDVLKGHWPEFYGVGGLPAHGLYARHVDGLCVENFSVKTVKEDARAAVFLDDVTRADIRRVASNGKPVVARQK